MSRLTIFISATLMLVLAVVPAAGQANLGGMPGNCNKACLRGLADAYFTVLVAHDPSKALLAPGAKFK